MKRITALFTLSALILLLAFSAAPVRAADEIPDWDTVQWEDFSFRTLDNNTFFLSLNTWLRTEADLHDLFQVQKYNTYASLYALGEAIINHFLEDPENFIRTLAKEDQQTRELVYSSVVYSLDCTPDDTITVLQKIRLSGSDSTEIYAVLRELIAYAEKAYEVEINNPKTGDNVELIAAIFVLCSGGILATVSWKKEFY